MFLKKVTKSIALALISVTISIPMLNNVSAMESTTTETINQSQYSLLTDEEREYLQNWLAGYGVDESTIDSLIQKFENGEKWDSFNNEKQDLGTSEIISDSEEKITYPDGSITIKSLDFTDATFEDAKTGEEFTEEEIIVEGNNEGGISIQAVSGGKITKGSGYINVSGAKVSQAMGAINASFKASYTFVQSGYDQISSVYDAKIVIVGGTYERTSFGRVRIKESLSGDAKARLAFDYTMKDDWTNGNCWLDLFVGNDRARSSYSF